MDIFKEVKITKEEARRVASMELAIRLHNFRSDVSRETGKVISDAKIIVEFLETGI